MKTTKATIAALLVSGSIWAMPSTTSAHPHTVNGHPIANSQLHAPFNSEGISCGVSPAAYGLEVAHHGPDLGTPGFGDGCYQTTVRPVYAPNGITILRYVPDTDRNPAID